MRYAQIRDLDVSNGEGVRVSLFVQGCDFHCNDCFNSSTWDWEGGEQFTRNDLKLLLRLCNKTYIQGLSILGGEPLHPKNLSMVTCIARAFKELCPNKDLWIWSGYTFESYISKLDILDCADVIVDGQFISDQQNYKLHFRGSENQRIWRKIENNWVVTE